MDGAIPLAYAPRDRRSAWRRFGKTAVVVGLAAAAAYSCQTARQRIAVLQSDLQIGPVDWWAVATSPTLLRTAWTLSANPNNAYAPGLQAPPGALEITPRTPLEYHDGQLHFDLVIANRGPGALILPPLVVAGELPAHEACQMSLAVVEPKSLLGPGVRVIGAHRQTSIMLAVPAPPRPSNGPLVVRLFGDEFRFMIHGGDRWAGSHWYPDWSEIPQSEIEQLP